MTNKKLSSTQILKKYEGIWTYNIDLELQGTILKPIISIYFRSKHKNRYLYQLVLGEEKINNCLYRIEKYKFKMVQDLRTNKMLPCMIVLNYRPENYSLDKKELYNHFMELVKLNDTYIQELNIFQDINKDFIKQNHLPFLLMDTR